MKSKPLHWWLPVAAVILATCAVMAVLLRPGYTLAAFGNTMQSVLLALLLSVTTINAVVQQGKARYFWVLMALASGLWLAATLAWTWFEVVVRQPVPVPFIADVLFFIHIVPMMGALAVRPHRPESSRLDFGGLDFTLLLLWWLYLYAFVVLPWQYVVSDVPQYGFSFNLLYLIENAIFIFVLAVLFVRVHGPWRRVYKLFLIAASVYALGSQLVNAAITRGEYHTGSLYDLPLVGAMILFIWAALSADYSETEKPAVTPSRSQAVLVSRMAMAAVLSLPFFAGWSMIWRGTEHSVIVFRAIVTLIAMFVLPFFVFLKQHLLDRELVRLLGISQHNYENLKRLQGQLVQAEKLAALRHFVAGAAHEINNPLTAIIGYSDLLEHDAPLSDERGGWVRKIGEQARRTQQLIKQLLDFAKQTPPERGSLDLNSVVANAVELRRLDLQGTNVRIAQELDPHLPLLWGDANQLLQVCFHIIGNAVDILKPSGGEVRVATRCLEGYVVVEFTDNGPGIKDPRRIFDPFYTTKPVGQGAGLGLSSCYGIISDHGGTISCHNGTTSGAVFTIKLPVEAAMETAAASARS